LSEQKTVAVTPATVARIPGFIAIGASAGGLHALTTVLCALPGDFAAPIAVVQHLDPRYRSLIAQILGRRTALSVRQVVDGIQTQIGTVYVAPPDYHLLVNEDGTLSLTQTVPVHFVRPSVDLLFESLARSFRDRAVAVILTGSGTDGASGASAIKHMGGTVIAQDDRAEFPAMPAAARAATAVDLVLPLEEIAPALQRLVLEWAPR
jgi:two-component system chemotaxis response regulator CheB